MTTETTKIWASFFSHIDNTIKGYAGEGAAPNDTLWKRIPSTDIRKRVIATDQEVANKAGFLIHPYAIQKFSSPLDFTGDICYTRASEMYFIEAEAMARSGDEAGARPVLYSIIRKRYPGYTLSTNTGQALLDEIFLQKGIELLGEGVIFFDFQRLKKPLNRI